MRLTGRGKVCRLPPGWKKPEQGPRGCSQRVSEGPRSRRVLCSGPHRLRSQGPPPAAGSGGKATSGPDRVVGRVQSSWLCLLLSLALPFLEHTFLSFLIVQDYLIWLCRLFTAKAPCQEVRFTKWSIYPVEELSLIHLQGWMLLSIRDTMAIGIPTISFIFQIGRASCRERV